MSNGKNGARIDADCKTIAIRGDREQGHKVIERLKLIGGINKYRLCGDENLLYYFLDNKSIIRGVNFVPIGYNLITLYDTIIY